MKRIISTLFGLAVLCLFAEAQAVPTTVSFTGRLSTSAGPVSGNVNLIFNLYTQASGGSSVWTETRNGIQANMGLVYVDLGATSTLDETDFGNSPLFLEITVSGEVLTPRLVIQSVPYAIRSQAANTSDTLGTIAPGDVVTTVTGAGGIAAVRTGNTVALTGTTTTGTAPIAVTGSAVSLTTCTNGQIYKMSGGSWGCAADTDTNNTYTPVANGGVAISGLTVGLISCSTNQVLKATGAGTWGCAADIDTNNTYTPIANGGVAISGTTVGLINCSTNQVLKATGVGTWGCAADIDTNTTYTPVANGGVAIAGTTVGLINCAVGQVIKATGVGTWGCAADSDTNSGGTLTGITTTAGSSGLDGGCTTGNCSLTVDPSDFNTVPQRGGTTGNGTAPPDTGWTSTLSDTITSPGVAGQVVAIGSSEFRCSNTSTTNTSCALQVGLNTSVAAPAVHARNFYTENVGLQYLNTTVFSVFPVAANTTLTVHLMLQNESAGDTWIIYAPRLVLFFVPD